MKNNRIRNRNRYLTAAVLGLMLVLMCGGISHAFPAIEKESPVTLTVNAVSKEDGAPISGLKLTLYKAADMTVDENGTIDFSLTDAFQSYEDDGKIEVNLYLSESDSSGWAAGAATLMPYVLADAREGKSFLTSSATTGEDGNASFSQLEQGLYLMTGSYEGTAYSNVEVTPAFLTLPQWMKDSSEWKYQVTADAKLAVTPKDTPETPETPSGETPETPSGDTPETSPDSLPATVSVSVKKVWSGDDDAAASKNRPASVTVQLIDGNGTVVDTQTLSSSNGWAFTWEGLNQGQWFVMEKDIPDNYSVSQEEQNTDAGKVVTITNTTPANGGVLGASREKTPESESEKKTTTKKNTDNGKVKGSNREKEETGRGGDTSAVESAARLPQTGQLWWPVWLLAGIAAVLVILGLILRISGKKDLKE